MKIYIGIICLSLLIGCHSKEDIQQHALSAENDSLQKEIRKLSQDIKEIKSIISNQNEQSKITPRESDLKKHEVVEVGVLPAKNKLTKLNPKAPKVKQEIAARREDFRKEKTLFYKNTSNRSVYFTRWKDDRQDIFLYDPNGNEMYRLENVQLSYSIRAEIKSFHPNGAVHQVSVHTNPGASMYMYESIITFSDHNEPLTKEDFTSPARLEDFMNNVSNWNKEKNQWVKPQ